MKNKKRSDRLLAESMPLFHHKRKKYRFLCLAISVLIALSIGIIPVRIAIAHLQAPVPQVILALGGGPDREKFTAQFAQTHRSLEIWVSSGTRPDKAREIFQAAGIPDDRVHLDRRAVDTVTNFTSLVADFKSLNIQHLYLITSDFHMRRATAIAILVLGSRGIAFTPVPIPSNQPLESWLHVLRDFGRALFWIVTGHTGASLNPPKLNIK
nr:YdcF family protein [Coleofasciculus sp. FACHB-1120]